MNTGMYILIIIVGFLVFALGFFFGYLFGGVRFEDG